MVRGLRPRVPRNYGVDSWLEGLGFRVYGLGFRV